MEYLTSQDLWSFILLLC